MQTEMVAPGAPRFEWNKEQERIIREQFADGCDDDELAVLLYNAQRRKLDPFLGHLRGIKRWNSSKGREVMAIQTSIDAFRLIADRTGKYGGGPAPTFEVIEKNFKGNRDLACTLTVRKLCGNDKAGYIWHEVTEVAYYREYMVTKQNGKPVRMWAEKPHIMLAKCTEARALRRAFPEELGGLYTDDEMGQADNPVAVESASQEKSQDPQGGEVVVCAHCRVQLKEGEKHACENADAVDAQDAAAMKDAHKRCWGDPDKKDLDCVEPALPGRNHCTAHLPRPAAAQPVETAFYTPDAHQRRRFEAACAKVLTDSGPWVKRSMACATARDFDKLTLEVEDAVGGTQQEGAPS